MSEFSVLTIPSTFRRRAWVTEAESLLLSSSPIHDLVSVGTISEFLGVDPRDLLLSRMCAVSLPSPELPRPRRGRFWQGIRAEALWHPLVWLPASVRDRRRVHDEETGETRLEYDDAYAIRIAATLMGSALYDADDGSWADILSLIGIDVDSEVDRRRVQAWLDGAPDAALDSLDITSLIGNDAQELGELLAREEGDLIEAGMYRSASDLITVVDSVIDPQTGVFRDGVDQQEAGFTLHLCALAAMYSFSSLGLAESETWRVDAQAVTNTRAVADLVERARAMRARFVEIEGGSSNAFGAAVTMLAELEAGGDAGQGGS